MARESAIQLRLRDLLHYWFVQYNPLLFFSALSVLAGVLLVFQGLQGCVWDRGRLGLALVVQSYEILLVASAALLFRKARQTRPAVILAVLEIFFLFDWTTQSESLATLGPAGQIAGILWVLLAALKVLCLAWIFRLTRVLPLAAATALAAAAMSKTPQLIFARGFDGQTVHLVSTWLWAGLLAAALWLRPTIRFAAAASDNARLVLRRIEITAWSAMFGLYGLHLLAWLAQFHLPLTWQHVCPLLLLLPFVAPGEAAAWFASAGAAALGLFAAGTSPGHAIATAGACAIVLALFGRRLHAPRLYLGSVLAFYIAAAAVDLQAGASPHLALTLLAALVVTALSWHLRLWSGIVFALVALLPALDRVRPGSRLEWGIAALAIGFVNLVVGVAIAWDRRHGAESAGRNPQP